jgi:GNAT superfamily N-acetyltransferase
MKYIIKELDLSSSHILKSCTKLVNFVFNLNISEDKLLINTNTRNRKSLFLGAYLEGELAAINFFIGHEFLIQEKTIFAHQSCWSATHPNHRKKGLFTQLINAAKDNLKQKNSSFIFGFPNQNSESIFIHKLGFRSIPLKKLNIPTKLFPMVVYNIYTKKNLFLDVDNYIKPIESEIIELKKSEFGEQIKIHATYNNIIWGKITFKDSPLGKVSFFNIGGIQINKPNLLRLAYESLVNSEKVDFIQIVASKTSSIWKIFKFGKIARKTEPLIIYDLNLDTTNLNFNISTGIKDVF